MELLLSTPVTDSSFDKLLARFMEVSRLHTMSLMPTIANATVTLNTSKVTWWQAYYYL